MFDAMGSDMGGMREMMGGMKGEMPEDKMRKCVELVCRETGVDEMTADGICRQVFADFDAEEQVGGVSEGEVGEGI